MKQEDFHALGVRVGTVALVEHNPRWATTFAIVSSEVSAALGCLRPEIEHIGSTSVSGLAAKPLLDVAVGITEPFNRDAVATALTTIGLNYQGDFGDFGGLLFTFESSPDVVALNLHVVDLYGFQWRWYRTFRDALRADPALCAEYEQLKREASTQYADHRQGYNAAKFEWVLSTVRRLDAEGGAGAPD